MCYEIDNCIVAIKRENPKKKKKIRKRLILSEWTSHL